jgi:hypothetical protein
MPVGETVEFAVMPSGEVAPMLGVGLTIPLTCALAALQKARAGRSAGINAAFTRSLGLQIGSSGTRLSDMVGLPSVVRGFEDQQGQMLELLSSAPFNLFCLALNLQSLFCSDRFAGGCGRNSPARG